MMYEEMEYPKHGPESVGEFIVITENGKAMKANYQYGGFQKLEKIISWLKPIPPQQESGEVDLESIINEPFRMIPKFIHAACKMCMQEAIQQDRAKRVVVFPSESDLGKAQLDYVKNKRPSLIGMGPCFRDGYRKALMELKQLNPGVEFGESL